MALTKLSKSTHQVITVVSFASEEILKFRVVTLVSILSFVFLCLRVNSLNNLRYRPVLWTIFSF